ncbi:MAG: DUF3179 domain-containing protein, partial [Bacteroidales bacterium]|nr:DUF3179 domain-containing protein [Bacteroidales bacterium]
MKNQSFLIGFLAFSYLFITGCETDSPPGNNQSNSGGKNGGDWLIPVNEILDGGPGKDGIPALADPDKHELNNESNAYLSDADLVLGFGSGGEIIAYPHPILDWHEIVNDKVGNKAIAITYCPLTGTGIGWNRVINNKETTFGVSGLLYNSNLIPYDRLTGSNWSQIGLLCVNGELSGTRPDFIPMVEMPWGKWKELFPQSMVISSSTGYNRNYGYFPYGDYKTGSWLLFPASPTDDRLHEKERVLGVIINEKAKVYRFESFGTSMEVIQDDIDGISLTIAGVK